MDDRAQEQVEDETRRLVAIVEEITGLHSRWSGRIVWEDTLCRSSEVGTF